MGSEYRRWNAWRLTLSSSLEEMSHLAFMSIGSLILLPCQDLESRLSTLGFPTQFLGKSLAVYFVVKIPSLRLSFSLPGLGPCACVTAAGEHSFE
jgi:hypothetical protein